MNLTAMISMDPMNQTEAQDSPESISLLTLDELSMVGGGQDTATLG